MFTTWCVLENWLLVSCWRLSTPLLMFKNSKIKIHIIVDGYRHSGYRLEDIFKLSLCKHMQNM